MLYCWQPALAAAAVAAQPATTTKGEVGAAAAALNHTWDEVIRQLETVREMRKPIFRFL